MDVFTCCMTRRSCRKYLSKPVEFEKLGVMVEAACHAPSAGNLQHWKFVLVTDSDMISKIADFAYQQYWIKTAPALIAACSLYERPERFYGKRGSQLYAIQSVAAAIENMLLTATAMGLGTCWVGGFFEERVKDLLKVPSNVNLHALITVGYPDEEPTEKDVAPLNSSVFFNEYGMPFKNFNKVMKDYSLEWEAKAKAVKPKVNQLLERLRKVKDDVIKKRK